MLRDPGRDRRRRVRSCIGLAIACIFTTVLIGSFDAEAGETPRLEYGAWKVALSAPPNWRVDRASPYPNILVALVRSRPQGKMLLSAERLPASEYDDAGRTSEPPSLRYCRATAKILTAVGFTVSEPRPHSSGAFWIDYTDGKAYLRQAFVVADYRGFSLVLSAHGEKERSAQLRAFDATLRSLRALPSSDVPVEAREHNAQ